MSTYLALMGTTLIRKTCSRMAEDRAIVSVELADVVGMHSEMATPIKAL